MNAQANSQGERADILGVCVSAINMEDAVSLIEHRIATRVPTYVCITSVHGIIESLGHPRLRKIHNDAGLVTPDGMPLVWMSRWLGFDRTRRVYGPDLMRTLTALSVSRGYRHFYYGGDHCVADRLKQTLIRSHPGLQVVGTLTPPFRPLSPEEDDAVIAQINAAKPDIVWVGLIMRLHDEFGLSVSDDTIYRALKDLGFSHVSARPKAYKQDADAMAAFKKTLPYAWRKSARHSRLARQ